MKLYCVRQGLRGFRCEIVLLIDELQCVQDMKKYSETTPKSASHDWVAEALQVVTPDLIGPISPTALGTRVI